MLIYFFIAITALVWSLYSRWTGVLWAAAAALFAFYFGLQGQAFWLYILFMVGIVCIILELYIPDFGLTGSVGLIAFVLALWLKYKDLGQVTLVVFLTMALVACLLVIFSKLGKELQFSPGFILQKSLTESQTKPQDQDYSELVGQLGQALTALRPVGKVQVAGHNYEAYSLDQMISADQAVEIVKVVDQKIYVRSVSHD